MEKSKLVIYIDLYVTGNECVSSNLSLQSVFPSSQIQTVTKKVEVIVEEEVNATTVEGLVANITKEPQFVIKKSLQFKGGMNVLGMFKTITKQHLLKCPMCCSAVQTHGVISMLTCLTMKTCCCLVRLHLARLSP